MSTAATLKKAFIDPKNQEILWELMKNHPLIGRVQPQAEVWFREVIAYVYEQPEADPTTPLYESLLKLNQKTLLFMVKQLEKEGMTAHTPTAATAAPDQTDKIMQVVQGENKIKFDQEKDTPIRNIEQLLLEQKTLRDQDLLPPLTPPPPPTKAEN